MFDTYIVLGILGEGGNGRVYRVQNTDGETYALKCLFDKVPTSKRKRFHNELNFCKTVEHRNIVRVFDEGFAQANGVKCPFYVMQAFPGTLEKLMESPLAPDRVLRLFSQILDGVEAAHLNGATHRDLKPQNILYDPNGDKLVVADFGIALFEEDRCATYVETKPGDKMCNFMYAAPEQKVREGKVDKRADIYALGLILNEMFTGQVPQGEGYQTIGTLAPEFAHLDEVVSRMIQHSPDARFENIAAVKIELRRSHNEFAARQVLDVKRKEVVSADGPPPFDPIKPAGFDWKKGKKGQY